MISRNYSIHDIVRFKIIDHCPFNCGLIDKTKVEFENFETSEEDSVDFSVEIGSFSRSEKECFILDDRYFVDNGYFYCKDKYKCARWALEIQDIENKPRIRISTNYAGYYIAPFVIIDFFILYTFLKKGRILIHASGVEKDGRCLLFSARGGGGKTTMALSLVDKGYKYLGDNFVLMDKEKVRSFISPLNIFSYNRLDIVERNLSKKQRISMEVKKLIYKITGGYIKIFEKINPSALFPEQIINESNASRICILEPNSNANNKEVVIRDIDTKTLIKRLRYNMEMDSQLFCKYLHSYAYVNPNSFWADFWENYEKILTENLPKNISACVVQVPIRYNPEFISRLVDAIG